MYNLCMVIRLKQAINKLQSIWLKNSQISLYWTSKIGMW